MLSVKCWKMRAIGPSVIEMEIRQSRFGKNSKPSPSVVLALSGGRRTPLPRRKSGAIDPSRKSRGKFCCGAQQSSGTQTSQAFHSKLLVSREPIGEGTLLRPAGVTMPGPSTKGPKPTDKHVGARIRMRRLMLGMTQTTLGDAVSLTFQQIQKYEKGTNRISASRMQQVAKVLDVPMSFFFEGAPEAQVTGNRKRSTKGAVTPAYVTDFLSSRDGQDIIKAFSQIKDRQLQRKIIDLAKELAAKTVH